MFASIRGPSAPKPGTAEAALNVQRTTLQTRLAQCGRRYNAATSKEDRMAILREANAIKIKLKNMTRLSNVSREASDMVTETQLTADVITDLHTKMRDLNRVAASTKHMAKLSDGILEGVRAYENTADTRKDVVNSFEDAIGLNSLNPDLDDAPDYDEDDMAALASDMFGSSTPAAATAHAGGLAAVTPPPAVATGVPPLPTLPKAGTGYQPAQPAPRTHVFSDL